MSTYEVAPNDIENSLYNVKINDVMLRTENSTGFTENGLVATPAISETATSLSKIELTRKGQPHLTLEKESIGSEKQMTLLFSGILLKGIPMSPYNRVGDDGGGEWRS